MRLGSSADTRSARNGNGDESRKVVGERSQERVGVIPASCKAGRESERLAKSLLFPLGLIRARTPGHKGHRADLLCPAPAYCPRVPFSSFSNPAALAVAGLATPPQTVTRLVLL